MDLRKWTLGAVLAAGLLGAGCAAAQPAATARPQCREANPLFTGADPHAVVIGDHYWVYTTARGTTGDGDTSRMYAYRSPDLRCWTEVGPVFTSVGVGWLDDGSPWRGLWAPGVAQTNGGLQLYYSVGPQAAQRPSRLGLARGAGPAGPFRDTGGPLLTGGDGFEAIDPMVFTDSRSGSSYLYLGGSAGGTLRMFELNSDMSWFKREVPVTQQLPFFTEGPFVHERNGVYYLSYSHGSWNRDTYSAHYATGPSPTGPWTYRGVLMHSQGARRGPGHHSIVRNPRTDEWFVVYHRWETKKDDPGPFQGDRVIAIQRLVHDADGTLRRIDLDDNAVPVSPLRAP